MMSLAAPLTWSAQLSGNATHGYPQALNEGNRQGQGQMQAPRTMMSDGIGIAKWVHLRVMMMRTLMGGHSLPNQVLPSLVVPLW